MPGEEKKLTPAQKNAADFLRRPKTTFSQGYLEKQERKQKERTAGAEVKIYLTAKIGDDMPDGTVYAGISPDTGQRMFASPMDSPLMENFNDASRADSFRLNGRDGFRLPTKNELHVLYLNSNKGGLKDTFNRRHTPGEAYWSSTFLRKTPNPLVYVQMFSDGLQFGNFPDQKHRVRYIKN